MIVYLTFFGYPLNLLHPLHYQFGLSEGGHVHPWSLKCKTMGSSSWVVEYHRWWVLKIKIYAIFLQKFGIILGDKMFKIFKLLTISFKKYIYS